MKRIVVFVFLVSSLFADQYWVDDNGAATWANAKSATPLSGTSCTTYLLASTNAVAGDTIWFRAGTYTIGAESVINPSNSGTSGNPIVFTVYSDEVVNLVGQADVDIASIGIWINAKSYIVVNGKSLGQLNLSKMKVSIVVGPWSGASPTDTTSYNELAYLYVYNSYENDDWSWIWQGVFISKMAIYNHIHHCKFEKHGYLGDEDSENEGNLFDLGAEGISVATNRTYYNVIENNEFLHGGHATFGFFGDHNVVRNNYFHNEGWCSVNDTLYGYRNIIGDGEPDYTGYNIFEGNRIGHAAPNYTWTAKSGNWGGAGIKLCHAYNIVRYNFFFNNQGTAFAFGTYTDPLDADGDYSHIYNNTFFSNGWYVQLPYDDYKYFDIVNFGYTGSGNWPCYSAVFKNNLFYSNANSRSESYDVWESGNSSPLSDVIDPAKGNVTLANNYNADAGANIDPLFADTTLSDSSSWVLPNLSLSAGSPAIDQGDYLTQASGAGSSKDTLIVDDARYFQDSNFGGAALSWPSSVTIAADWIAIGTVNDTVQIESINYTTNTIVLVSAMTWSDNANVWLYKDSDGTRILLGDNADAGAYEYAETEEQQQASQRKTDVVEVK